MGKFIDLTGQRFGRLVVVDTAGKNDHGDRFAKCICDCGNQKVVRITYLKSAKTQSCGCLRNEKTIQRNKAGEYPRTHGEWGTRLYRIWNAMNQRCGNPNSTSYKNYGARGISVCTAWRHSYTAFRNWAMQNGYQDDLSIDRIDNDKGYSPDNCRWATIEEQLKNRRPYKKKGL